MLTSLRRRFGLSSRLILGGRPSGRAVDLPDGAQVMSLVGDAASHPGRLDVAQLPRRAERIDPRVRLVTERVAEGSPFDGGTDVLPPADCPVHGRPRWCRPDGPAVEE